MKSLLPALLLLPAFLLSIITESAAHGHGGRLDKNGGHHDRKNGGYHTHRSSYTPPPPEDAESREDSVRTSPPLVPRQLARTEARTSSRTEARTSGKLGRSTDDSEKQEWTFNDLEAMQQKAEDVEQQALMSAKPNLLKPEFSFFEMNSDTDNAIPNYHYVVTIRGDSSKPLKDSRPTEIELLEFSKKITKPSADLFFYLNGMGWTKLNWSHISIRDGKASCWTRDILDTEFKQNLVLNLKHEIREWQSKDGKFSVVARYYSRKGDEISLFKENGERLWVTMSKLSDRDIEYLKRHRIF